MAGYDRFNDIRSANYHQSGSDYRILGTTTDGQGIAPAQIEQILTALGCTLSPSGHNTYQVTLPSRL